jgi:gliding motility-associated protein GldC
MRKTQILFEIELDGNNIPTRIYWQASDKPDGASSETKTISVALWDPQEKNTLRIDLWTKDMPVSEMKRFYIDCLGGMAQSILRATGDEFFARQTEDLCERLVEYVKKENQRSG